MVSPVTLDALRVLDAIDRKQSFAAAADELHRVPSALSYTVAKLERDLGVELFDRTQRRARLTSVGALMLRHGRPILAATEALTRVVVTTGQGWESDLRLAVDSVLDLSTVFTLIDRFRSEGHPTEVSVTEEALGGCWDALGSGRAEIALGAAGDSPLPGLATHPLGRVDFVFAVSATHPLCDLDEPIPDEALREFPHIVVADSSRSLPPRSLGLLDGLHRIVVPTISAKIQAQACGLGIGYLPLHRIQLELARGRFKTLTLKETRPPLPISIAWRNENRGRAQRWFVDALKRYRFDTIDGLVQNESDQSVVGL